ncbi:MAG TPA: hypothetical protein VF698_06885 [Thermoanaerobaculia bacterium]
MRIPRGNNQLQLTRPGFVPPGRAGCFSAGRGGVTPVAGRASLASGHALQPVRRYGFGTRNRPLN